MVKIYILGGLTYIVVAIVTYMILVVTNYDNTSIIFITGTISSLAIISWAFYKRGLRWKPTLIEKLKIAIFLVIIALVVITVLQLMFNAFAVPLVTYVVTPIGVILFSLFLTDQFSKAWNQKLEKTK
jgi:hypothetical protein